MTPKSFDTNCSQITTEKRSLIGLLLAILILLLVMTVDVEAGYKVQQGGVTMNSGITSLDIALPDSVGSLDKSFVILHYFYAHRVGVDARVQNDEGMVNAYLWDDGGTTKIRFARHDGAVTIHFSGTVIECTDDEFTVYRGSQGWSGNTTLYTPAIGATVNGDHCFAWVNGTTSDQVNRERCREAHFTADVSSGSQTTLNLRRYQVESSPTGTLRWIVVEFDTSKIGGIDTGEETITTQQEDSRATWTISGCIKSQSLLFGQWRVSGDDGLNAHAIAIRMADDTTGEAYVHLANNYNRVLRWYCIDFGPDVGSRQEGQVNNSANPNWRTADQTLSPTLNTTRAVSFVTLTCNGNGTAFPRPMVRHWVSSASTLEIERDYDGQASWIEWQVLELPAHISVSVSNSTFAFGTNPLDTWISPQASTITNDGNAAENFLGRISQLTDGSDTWEIDVSANGADTIRAQWSTTSAAGPWTDISSYDADFTIAANVAVNDSVNFWLRIQTPTSTSSYNEHSSTLTVTAQEY